MSNDRLPHCGCDRCRGLKVDAPPWIAAIQNLWSAISIWSQQTFGTDKERGPIGPLKHLKLEVDEAIESVDEAIGNGAPEEFADCLILLFDAARKNGMTLESLIGESLAKMVINAKREWPRPAPGEPAHHITVGRDLPGQEHFTFDESNDPSDADYRGGRRGHFDP